jgi:glycolate oxidase
MSLSKALLKQLISIVGKTSVLTSEVELRAYSYDGTSDWQNMPDVVVFSSSEKQISEIMVMANEHDLPVTVRGAGTNLSGGSVPIKGGIILCTARMNHILDIDGNNFTTTVEAGVVLNDLNISLAKNKLFFPPDPQSFLAATIGGCVSENSGGPYAVKYGIFKHYLLGMRVVLPTGEIVNLGGRTMKNVMGYDLPQLLCGSEGTLAIITQATLRVISLPETRQTVLAVFNDVVDAGKAVGHVLSMGLLPAKIEFIDNWIIQRIEENTPMGLPREADAILLFEIDGMAETVEKETRGIIDFCSQAGAVSVKPAKDAAEANNFWTARRAGFSAIYGNAPTVLGEDVTVPINQLPTLIQQIKEICETYGVTIPLIGHAGDGNLHPCILTDKKNPEQYAKARQAASDIFDAALSLGGVLSGEHGIGLEKKEFLSRAMEPAAIELLRKIRTRSGRPHDFTVTQR